MAVIVILSFKQISVFQPCKFDRTDILERSTLRDRFSIPTLYSDPGVLSAIFLIFKVWFWLDIPLVQRLNLASDFYVEFDQKSFTKSYLMSP
ncbi:MAG: hypothetical protein D6728_11110 [Cyanobacteria bacterium J055]|nr:MAG: hypothetical protein D6728_11110 [Cyanobacteria bacterium J055]